MNGIDWKIARIRKGLPQHRVATMLGISQSSLSQFENDYREMPPAFKERLTEIYGLEEEEGQ